MKQIMKLFLNANMKKSSVTLEITSESIYMHSISVLSFFSEDEFKVRLSYEKTRISKGIREKEEWIKSINIDNNIYCIEVSVIGLFQERSVINNIKKDVLGNHYGMRFYPFLSSYIRGKIECDRRILNASLKLPDAYRLLFFKSSIKQNKKPSTMRQSYGNKESSFLFTWNDFIKPRQDNNNYNLYPQIFVRLGGKSLFKLVKFPIYYWTNA